MLEGLVAEGSAGEIAVEVIVECESNRENIEQAEGGGNCSKACPW
jgi:hypothetical protein